MAEKEPPSLKQLRINTWLDACFQVSGCKTLACVHEKSGLDVESNVWTRYKNGYLGKEYEPSPMTVNRVDQSLPGTGVVFLVGPAGLSLWDVLEGNPSACEKVLHGQLEKHVKKASEWMLLSKKTISEMTLMEKCQALIELCVPSAWFEKPAEQSDEDLPEFWWADEDNPPKAIDLRFADTSKFYMNLQEVMTKYKKQENILALAYSEYFKRKSYKPTRAITSKFSGHLKLYGEFKIANPKNIMALLAAAVHCVINSKIEDSIELSFLYEYILDGINEATKTLFGEEINFYINETWNL